MITRMPIGSRAVVAVILSIVFSATVALGQGTGFTYQGRLTDGGTPANGNYDLQFALWDSLSGGNQIGTTQTLNSVGVSSGIFTVTLDFGANAFPGASRFLEISARPTGAGSFTLLTPRAPISSTPYAVRSLGATAADGLSSACTGCVQDSQINAVSGSKITGAVANATNATTATTASNATQLGGVNAANYVQTNDSRLTDAQPPTPGSSNYIQNTASQQLSSNFNISGNGALGGTLTVAGNVGIGTASPTSKLEIAAQDGLAITGYQPFLTLRDTNASNRRAIIAGGNGDFVFFPDSFIGGNPAVAIKNTSGNVGIGTASPTSKLEIAAQDGLAITGYQPFLTLRDTNASNKRAIIAGGNGDFGFYPDSFIGGFPAVTVKNSSGFVGIGTATPQYALDVNGIALLRQGLFVALVSGSGSDPSVCAHPATGGYDLNLCLSSSLRYKTNVATFLGGLDIINRLRPISFKWKQDGTKDIGLGAEEVEKVEPLLTFRNSKGEIEGVRYNQLSAVFINAFKEQQAQIRRQQQKLTQQEAELTQQQQELKALKALVCRSHRRARACR